MGDANAGNEGQLGDTLNGEGQGLDPSGNNNMDNPQEPIEEFDWDGLEERFWAKMEECKKVEEGLMEEFGELIEVCFLSFLHRPVRNGGASSTGGSFAEGIGATGRCLRMWADGGRSSMRGRLLVLWVRRRGPASGIAYPVQGHGC